MTKKILPSSFRDPSGFLYFRGKQLFRQINSSYKENYDYLISSSLYETLTSKNLLIAHTEVKSKRSSDSQIYKKIKPKIIPFVSYPYEWCFGQLKDAALLTLQIQKLSMKKNMSLKDASSYNVQFVDGKPIFIDTLSFEKYRKGNPWIAYRQFSQHFLAPLFLASYKDIRLIQLLKNYIDGIPIDLASKLLPLISYLNPSILGHIHFQAKSQQVLSKKPATITPKKLSFESLFTLIENLESTIENLELNKSESFWEKYYEDTNYSKAAFKQKEDIVEKLLLKVRPKIVWDIGANIGYFSRISGNMGALTVSIDSDPMAVEKNYRDIKEKSVKNVLPLVNDFINPSAPLGWANEERQSLIGRGPVDCIMALALIHHLVISNNLPFEKIAKLFSEISKNLIIEFIPKRDSNVKLLLSQREDIFKNYTFKEFERSFRKYFNIIDSIKIKQSKRIVYLMNKKK